MHLRPSHTSCPRHFLQVARANASSGAHGAVGTARDRRPGHAWRWRRLRLVVELDSGDRGLRSTHQLVRTVRGRVGDPGALGLAAVRVEERRSPARRLLLTVLILPTYQSLLVVVALAEPQTATGYPISRCGAVLRHERESAITRSAFHPIRLHIFTACKFT